MSYDVYLRSQQCCPTCHRELDTPEGLHPTYNLTEIFHLALTGEEMPNQDVTEASAVLFRAKTDVPRGLRQLDNKTGRESVELLEEARRRMRDPKMSERFNALAPENGWGTVDGARRTLGEMLYLASQYPDYVWDIR